MGYNTSMEVMQSVAELTHRWHEAQGGQVPAEGLVLKHIDSKSIEAVHDASHTHRVAEYAYAYMQHMHPNPDLGFCQPYTCMQPSGNLKHAF